MKRCLSMILVFLMCLSLVPQGASAQTVSTEELLFLLAEYLTDGASSGLEVEIEPHGGEGGKVIYSPNGENGAELALVTPEGCIGLDAQGVYIDRDGKTAGVAMDELTSFLLESTLGISHLPRFSAHDGAMLVGLLDTLWSNVMQDAVRFETDGLSQASLEIDVDRLAVSVDDTLNRLLEEYAAEVDVLLNEYGGLLGNFVYGFPQNVGELKALLNALNMKSVQTGMTVSLNVVWAEDFWQADGVVFGWNAEAAWEGGAFTATVSPSELLPEGLPTYTLDSRDLERLMLLVGGLFETVPEDALSFSGGSLMGRGYSFRIDTERLRGYIDRKMPIYLKSHETEINALVEKYMPFLTLFSPQAEQWGDAAWLSNRMYRLAEMLPRNFRAEVTLARSWFAGNWQLDAVVNEYTLSASVGYGNVTAILSVSDDYGVYSYKLDARLTESGAEMVCGVTEDGRTQQLTVCLIEETDGYLVEAYTEKERFYASLRLEEKEARLEVSEYGQRVATGSVKVAGNYVYVDWISDELTLDGTLIVGDGTYAMTLLVNGYPVTAKLELPNYYWGGAFECHSDGIDLEAEVGHYGMRLYADARGIFNSRKENALLLEILPLQNRYGFVVKEYAKSSPGALMDLAEYGFTYSTGRLSIMKGRQTVTVSDVTAWTDGCLNAVDVTVFDMLRGIGQSVRVITRAEGSDVLIADVYAEGADEAALTVTIRRRIEPMNLPEPDSWLSAEEFLKMMGY